MVSFQSNTLIQLETYTFQTSNLPSVTIGLNLGPAQHTLESKAAIFSGNLSYFKYFIE